MTQPPLTRLISSLEEDLGTSLFERTTRQVKLTSAGIHLLKEGREILAKVERMQNEVRAIGKLRAGHLTIGFSTTSFLARLPKILDEFRLRNPPMNLELEQGSRKKVLSGLRSGQMDAVFVEGIVLDKGYSSQIVKDEALGALVAKNHPLAKRKKIALTDLGGEVIILHPRQEHSEFFDTIQQLFAQNGINPKTYIKREGESCPILVSLRKGIVLTIAGSQSKVPEETRFIPIVNLQLPVSVAWLPTNANPQLKNFLNYVAENAVLGSQKVECLADVMRR